MDAMVPADTAKEKASAVCPEKNDNCVYFSLRSSSQSGWQ
jgi:hypothetical protein